MSAHELQPGLWHWQALHPQWTPQDWWPAPVSSYAVDDGTRLLLIDPLAPPAEIEGLIAAREAVIVLTCPWHERSSQDLVARLGLAVWAPAADPGSPDLAWLAVGGGGPGRLYSLGSEMLEGITVLPGHRPNDLVLSVAECDAVVFGDTLVDFGAGLELNARWLPEGVTREDVARPLRRLLATPPRHLLATHGGPQTMDALARALDPHQPAS